MHLVTHICVSELTGSSLVCLMACHLFDSQPLPRDHSVNVSNQWEIMLHGNVISHWLGAYTKWSLHNMNQCLLVLFMTMRNTSKSNFYVDVKNLMPKMVWKCMCPKSLILSQSLYEVHHQGNLLRPWLQKLTVLVGHLDWFTCADKDLCR